MEKENEILQKKDPFPKTLEDMCRVLEGWKNDNKHNRFSDANDGVAFVTTDAEASKGSKGKAKTKKSLVSNVRSRAIMPTSVRKPVTAMMMTKV